MRHYRDLKPAVKIPSSEGMHNRHPGRDPGSQDDYRHHELIARECKTLADNLA